MHCLKTASILANVSFMALCARAGEHEEHERKLDNRLLVDEELDDDGNCRTSTSTKMMSAFAICWEALRVFVKVQTVDHMFWHPCLAIF